MTLELPCQVCMSISVDIDRWADADLEQVFLPVFRDLGCQSAADIKRLCGAARDRGLVCFPTCDNVDARGRCQGHPVDG